MATHTNLSLQEEEEQEHFKQEEQEHFAFTLPFSANVTNFIIFLLICLAIYLAYEHIYKGSDSNGIAVPTVPTVPGRLNTFYF